MRGRKLGTHVLAVLIGAIATTACTTLQHDARIGNDAVSALPGPSLAGTWRGTAFAIPGSAYYTAKSVELRIEPDGTWAWISGGETEASGTVLRRDGRVIFRSGPATEMELQHTGDHLWGVTRTFIEGAQSAIDLRRDGA